MTGKKIRFKWLGPFLLSLVLVIPMLNHSSLEWLWLTARMDFVGDNALIKVDLWRLISAHFVHLNGYHALLNILGVWVCFAFSPSLFNWYLPFKLLYLSLGISLCILWWSPDLLPYAGLSGVLYGLFVFGLAPSVWLRDGRAALTLAVVSGWMLWQLLIGASAQEEELIGGKIASMAHFYGYCLAIVWLVSYRGIQRLRWQ